MNAPVYADKVRRMREEFDRTFAQPAQLEAPEVLDLLAIRVGGDGYALRVKEMSGLTSDRKIIPVPGPAPALLGLIGIRGGLVPVWDLAALLGYGGPRHGARWLVLGQGSSPWAVAFDGFDGYFRVPRSEVHSSAAQGFAAEFARESCALEGTARPVISLATILAAVEKISASCQTRRK